MLLFESKPPGDTEKKHKSVTMQDLAKSCGVFMIFFAHHDLPPFSSGIGNAGANCLQESH
jgi:hypothetical protein